MRRLGLLGLFVFLVPCIDVRAQSSSPSGFYQNNYAQAPEVNGQPLNPPRPPLSASQIPNRGAANVRDAMGTNPRVAGGPQSQTASSEAAEKKINAMLYVNSRDKAHFESMIKEAIRVQDRSARIRVLGVYHVGDYRNVEPWVQDELKNDALILRPCTSYPLNGM